MSEARCIIHPCGRTDDEGNTQPRVAAEGLLVCERHYEIYVEVLGELVGLYAMLSLDPQTRPKDSDAKAPARVFAPVPIRLEVLSLMDPRTYQRDGEGPMHVLGVLESWTRMICEERGITPTAQATVSGEVRTLTRNAQWSAGQPWFDDCYREVMEIRSQLRYVTGEIDQPVGICPEPDRRYPELECGGPLREKPGTGAIVCGKCRTHFATPLQLARLSVRLDATG